MAMQIVRNREMKYASAQSGYRESSLVANPRHHVVSVVVPAAPRNSAAVKAIAIDACVNIKSRLRYIQGVLKTAISTGSAMEGRGYARSQAQFVVTAEENGAKAVLVVRNESSTIGNLLRRMLYELIPGIGYVGYTCTPHEREMRLTVVHSVGGEDIGSIVLRAVKHAYTIFDTLQHKIKVT